MQGGRSISVIGASIASPPGVCLSILPVLQDASSREEAKISGAAQIGNRPCLHGLFLSSFSLTPRNKNFYGADISRGAEGRRSKTEPKNRSNTRP